MLRTQLSVLLGLAILVLGSLVFWITPIAHFKRDTRGAADFRTVYSGARCLLDSCNPYEVKDLKREYIQSAGSASSASNHVNFRKNLPVYPPSTLFWIVPFSLLPWRLALT